LTKKQKGSRNRKKGGLALAVIHERITNQRKDDIQQITSQLVGDNQAESFVIEDLNISGMLKNPKISQAIADVSFGEFFRQMKYKCEWYGKNLKVIGRYEPSSKTCSECGLVNETLTLEDREWTCAHCLTTHDRDYNAARNISNIGLKNSGEGISEEPVERQEIPV
jgi:putative transposase